MDKQCSPRSLFLLTSPNATVKLSIGGWKLLKGLSSNYDVCPHAACRVGMYWVAIFCGKHSSAVTTHPFICNNYWSATTMHQQWEKWWTTIDHHCCYRPELASDCVTYLSYPMDTSYAQGHHIGDTLYVDRPSVDWWFICTIVKYIVWSGPGWSGITGLTGSVNARHQTGHPKYYGWGLVGWLEAFRVYGDRRISSILWIMLRLTGEAVARTFCPLEGLGFYGCRVTCLIHIGGFQRKYVTPTHYVFPIYVIVWHLQDWRHVVLIMVLGRIKYDYKLVS